MEEESLLFSLKVDSVASEKVVKQLTDELDKLAAKVFLLTKADEESAKQIVELEKAIEKKTKATEKSSKAIEAEEGSIKALRESNKKLNEERNNTTTTTEEGRKKIQALNAQLDKNNETIKANVDAYTKQKMGVGGYREALEGLIPGLGGVTSGIDASTKAAWKFVANPIGAILAAIGLVLVALISYFKGSEAGSDKFGKAMAVVGSIIRVVTDRLIAVGDALVSFLSGDWKGGIDKMKGAFKGLGDEMQREINLAKELFDIFDSLEELELRQKIRVAELGNQIKLLEIASKNLNFTEAERSAMLTKAIELEKTLAGEQQAVHLARMNATARETQAKFSQFEAEQGANEDTIAFTKRLIANENIVFAEREKLAAQLITYNDLVDASATVQEKLLQQQSTIDKKETDRLLKLNAARKKELEDQLKEMNDWSKVDRKRTDEAMKKEFKFINDKAAARIAAQIKEVDDERKKRELIDQLRQADLEKERQALRDKITAVQESTALVIGILSMASQTNQMEMQAELSQNKALQQERLAALEKRFKAGLISEDQYNKSRDKINENALDRERKLKKKGFEAQKKNQIAAAIATTFQSALNAFNSLVVIPLVGPVLGAIAAAAALIFGQRQVSAIRATEFTYAKGGVSGTKISSRHGRPIYRANGDNVLITAKTGEVILNEHQQAKLGGAKTFAAIGVPGYALGGVTGGQVETRIIAENSAQNRLYQRMIDAIENQPQKVLVMEEFETKKEAIDSVKLKATL